MAKSTKPINLTEVEIERIGSMAAVGLLDRDIANIYKISETTLKRKYSVELQRGRSTGKASLLRRAHELAMSGNAMMLKFLCSNRCGMSEFNHIETLDKTKKQWEVKVTLPKMPIDPIEASKIYQKIMNPE